MTVWTMETALAYIRELQPRAMEAGWCIMLGGGVLNNGHSNSDLDILAYPSVRRASREDLFALLPANGQWSAWEDPTVNPVADIYTYTADGRAVDLIFWPHPWGYPTQKGVPREFRELQRRAEEAKP